MTATPNAIATATPNATCEKSVHAKRREGKGREDTTQEGKGSSRVVTKSNIVTFVMRASATGLVL